MEFEEPVRGIAFELLYDVRRSKDLFGMYEHMDMVGHYLHLSDDNAEGAVFFAHETLEVCSTFPYISFFLYLVHHIR